MKLFNKFDICGNGFLNLGEVKLGIRNVLGLSPVFINNQVVTCAFEAVIDFVSFRNENSLNKNFKLL